MTDAVKVFLPYGGRLLECEVPERNLLTIAEPPFGVPVEDEQRSIREAITKAIREELSTTLKPTDKVTIAVTDSTRPTPNSKVLPILLDELAWLDWRRKNRDARHVEQAQHQSKPYIIREERQKDEERSDVWTYRGQLG